MSDNDTNQGLTPDSIADDVNPDTLCAVCSKVLLDDGNGGYRCPDHGAFFGWSELTEDGFELPEPSHLHRIDGQPLLYPSAVNYVFGNPDTGKSWIALAACAESLAAGGTAVYIDADHNGKGVIAGRLRAMEIPIQVLNWGERFRHYEPDSAEELMFALLHSIKTMEPGVIVIDSTGEVVSLLGGDSNNNDDLTRWNRLVNRPPAEADWVVICIDHLAKGSDGDWPIGGMAKKRAVDGLMLHIKRDVDKPIAPDHLGQLYMNIRKDRNGNVSKSDPHSAGVFVLDSTRDNGVIKWVIEQPRPRGSAPTGCMQAISDWVFQHHGLDTRIEGGQAAVFAAMSELGFQRRTCETAWKELVHDKYLETKPRVGSVLKRQYTEAVAAALQDEDDTDEDDDL